MDNMNDVKNAFLTRYAISLFIIVFVSLFFFLGLIMSAVLALVVVIVQYFFDKYVVGTLNPYIDRFINWAKGKNS